MHKNKQSRAASNNAARNLPRNDKFAATVNSVDKAKTRADEPFARK